MSEIIEHHTDSDQPGKKRHSADYWQSHFREKENSGLSQMEYCRHHGIKYDTYQYWKQKLCKPKSKVCFRERRVTPQKFFFIVYRLLCFKLYRLFNVFL